jgi:hypothetical protein
MLTKKTKSDHGFTQNNADQRKEIVCPIICDNPPLSCEGALLLNIQRNMLAIETPGLEVGSRAPSQLMQIFGSGPVPARLSMTVNGGLVNDRSHSVGQDSLRALASWSCSDSTP